MKYKHCLIVDDEPEICEILAKQVQRLGFMPVVSGDGGQALVKADRQQFALMIIDLDLPKVNGLEMIRVLRKQKKSHRLKFPLPPIVIVSGNLTKFDKELKEFNDEYHVLEKPFDYDTLKQILLNPVKRPSPQAKNSKIDNSIMYNLSIHSLMGRLKNVCSGKPTIINEQEKPSPLIISNPLVGYCGVSVQGTKYNLYFSVSFDWCNQSAKAFFDQQDLSEISEESKIEAITHFYEDVMDNVEEQIRKKTNDFKVLTRQFYYNSSDVVYHRIDKSEENLQAHLDTSFGFLNFILCTNVQV